MTIAEAITFIDTEREKVLKEWEQDQDCQPKEHDAKDCKGKCDGYCIVHNLLARVAHELEKSSMEIRAL
jgi:hypothetical protein